MSGKSSSTVAKSETETDAVLCPMFVLRADRASHIHALIAIQAALSPEERAAVAVKIREFELWMDAHPEVAQKS
jgi:hypothetical protein